MSKNDPHFKTNVAITKQMKHLMNVKGAEATCVEIAIEMKKCYRLKDMLNFNVLWIFQPI